MNLGEDVLPDLKGPATDTSEMSWPYGHTSEPESCRPLTTAPDVRATGCVSGHYTFNLRDPAKMVQAPRRDYSFYVRKELVSVTSAGHAHGGCEDLAEKQPGNLCVQCLYHA